MKTFDQLLERGVILLDGAMGTMLYQRGIFLNRCFDYVCIEQPEIVRAIHDEYLMAGSEIITTNSFGANRLKLEKHGLGDRVEDINRASVQIARDAAVGRALVAGDIGPTGVGLTGLAGQTGVKARAALKEQIEILVDAGVDAICLETFDVVQELELAIEISKEVSDLPVIAACMFKDGGKTHHSGLKPEQVARRLVEAGADVVGANCGGGPEHIYAVAQPMVGCGRPVVAMANAGHPEMVEGRTIYVANPEFFGVFARRLWKAGITMVGGCCGTRPNHIRRMANAARMMLASQGTARIEPMSYEEDAQIATIPLAERSGLGEGLARGQFVTSVELNPPPGLDLSKKIQQAQELRDFGITTINIADGPRASLRMGNTAMAVELGRATGFEPLVHVCCRDRNYLGLQAHLLGLHVQGVRNLVAITGDPPKMGPYPHATGVYDLNSVGLLQVIQGFNHGVDPLGRTMNGQTSFVCATGAEPAAIDYPGELRRLDAKKSAGAHVVMTQPVYDAHRIEQFLEDAEGMELPVMLGLCPLASYRNARFLTNNVPGMRVPDDILARMAKAEEDGRGQEEGIAIARETLTTFRERINGAYIMPQFGRHKVAMAVLDGFIEKETEEPD